MAQLKDGTEYLKSVFVGKRPVYNVEQRDLSVLPESEVRQKIAKSNNWQVCKSWLDADNKAFIYEVMVCSDKSEMKIVSFGEACELLHWEKIRLSEDGQQIKWFPDKQWLEDIPKIVERAKKNTRRAIKQELLKTNCSKQ